MWTLCTADDTDLEKVTFRIGRTGLKTIGRATRADFVVDVPLVSRFHGRLTVLEGGALQVEDLDSTNGTFVNERRVTRAVLVAGDRLRVGRLELMVAKEDREPQNAEQKTDRSERTA